MMRPFPPNLPHGAQTSSGKPLPTSGRRTAILIAVFALFILIALILIQMMGSGDYLRTSDYVALVRVEGEVIQSDEILDQLEHHRKSPGLRAMVVRIDSPGGAVGASQEIFQELNRLRTGEAATSDTAAKAPIPVVVSFGNTAASGGYYIACGADRIVTNPGTITGSIGVILSSTEFSRLFSILGINHNTVTSGEYKDTGNYGRLMNDRDREMLQSAIDDVHDQFVDAVVHGRRSAIVRVLAGDDGGTSGVAEVGDAAIREHILNLADGRIITGRQALAAGLADMTGNLRDAVRESCRLANIPEDTEVYEREVPRTFLESLMESAGESVPTLTGRNTPAVQYRSNLP